MKLKRDPRPAAGASARIHAARLLGAAIVASTAVGSSAQTAQQTLPPTREQITPPAATPPPFQRRLEVEGGLAATPCALGGPEFQSIHFVLTGAEFDGLEGLTPAQLASTYAPYLNRDVPIATVCAIRDPHPRSFAMPATSQPCRSRSSELPTATCDSE